MSSRPSIQKEHQELKQHEVARLQHLFQVNRRDVFKLLGAGIVIGIYAPAALTQESGRSRGEEAPQNLDAWLHIGGVGKVTVFTGKAEMGQKHPHVSEPAGGGGAACPDVIDHDGHGRHRSHAF